MHWQDIRASDYQHFCTWLLAGKHAVNGLNLAGFLSPFPTQQITELQRYCPLAHPYCMDDSGTARKWGLTVAAHYHGNAR